MGCSQSTDADVDSSQSSTQRQSTRDPLSDDTTATDVAERSAAVPLASCASRAAMRPQRSVDAGCAIAPRLTPTSSMRGARDAPQRRPRRRRRTTVVDVPPVAANPSTERLAVPRETRLASFSVVSTDAQAQHARMQASESFTVTPAFTLSAAPEQLRQRAASSGGDESFSLTATGTQHNAAPAAARPSAWYADDDAGWESFDEDGGRNFGAADGCLVRDRSVYEYEDEVAGMRQAQASSRSFFLEAPDNVQASDGAAPSAPNPLAGFANGAVQ